MGIHKHKNNAMEKYTPFCLNCKEATTVHYQSIKDKPMLQYAVCDNCNESKYITSTNVGRIYDLKSFIIQKPKVDINFWREVYNDIKDKNILSFYFLNKQFNGRVVNTSELYYPSVSREIDILDCDDNIRIEYNEAYKLLNEFLNTV